MSARAILGHLAADATAELVARVRVALRVLWWGSALDAEQMHQQPNRPAGGAPVGTDAAVGDEGEHRHSSSNASPGASSVEPPLDGFRTSRAAEGSSEPRTSSLRALRLPVEDLRGLSTAQIESRIRREVERAVAASDKPRAC